MNAENIAELLMKLSPVKYACDWDNVGMHVGHKDNEINTINNTAIIRNCEFCSRICASLCVQFTMYIFEVLC